MAKRSVHGQQISMTIDFPSSAGLMGEVGLLMGSGQSVAKEDASIVHRNFANQSPDLIIVLFEVVFTRILQFV